VQIQQGAATRSLEKERFLAPLGMTGWNRFSTTSKWLAPAKWKRKLFGDDAVGPFNEAYEDGCIAELCAPLIQIGFRDATRPAAGPSSKDGNVFGADFFHRLAERGPTDRHDSIGRGFAHERSGFTKEEYLDLVAGVGERKRMQERKCGLGGIVGTPGTLHHNLESFLGLLSLDAQGKKRKT